MSTTLLDTRTEDSKAATYVVVLLLTLCFRPSMLYRISELSFALILAVVGGYFIVGKKGDIAGRKGAFVGLGILFYVYEAVQGVALGTASPAVVLRELGFMLGPALALLLINDRTWKSAVLAFITPVLFLLPSYLLSGVLTILSGSVDPIILRRFVLDMGDGTYDAVWAWPYSLYIDQTEIGPFTFGRATGFVREPGIYQVLLIIGYFAVDMLDVRYKRMLKGGILANIVLTFSTAGWGSFVAAWLYYNVFSSRGTELSGMRAFFRRTGAVVLSLPILYYVVYAETKVALARKLADSSVRVLEAINALQKFLESPIWGVGFQNPEVSTIHLIGTAAELGIVGILLIFFLILGPIWPLVRRRHPVLVFLVPLILTMLFAQPLFGTTLFFLILAIVTSYPLHKSDQDTVVDLNSA
jgi:hypothetical protein